MPVTVADLLRTPGLDVRPLTPDADATNAIRWVHVSELEDPTPWLKGGELLLTTGMGVGTTAARQRAYLRRLIGAGLAGLGIGTGFSFRAPPRALVAAAAEAGFPVFEVPYDVPFIAITEVVFTRLVAEQYDVLSRSLDAEHTLTKAVLDGRGVVGVVEALARATGGWALVFDLRGALVAAEPRGADVYLPGVWSEVQSRPGDGGRFSLSVVDRGQHIAIQPVGAQGRVEAYLALGKVDALAQFDRIVASHALALLALELAKERAITDTERRLKGDLLEKILSGELAGRAAEEALERIGFDLARPVAAIAMAGSSATDVASAAEEAWRSVRRGPFLSAAREDVVFALVQADGDGLLAELRAATAERARDEVLAGGGSGVPFAELQQTVREARYALQVCRTERRPQAAFADLGTYQLLLSLQDPDALRTFADSVLAPLDRYDRAQGGELLTSLRAFLERNARWEAAAQDLLVHRHTLRYRMRKVEELTGRPLSSARDRMEFFLALRARDLLASDGRATAGSRLARSDARHPARRAGHR